MAAQPKGTLPVALGSNAYPVAAHVPHADAENARLPARVAASKQSEHVPAVASPAVCT